MRASDEATHYLKDKVGLKEADRIVAAVRAEALREAAGEVVAYCPYHGNQETSYMACHCPVADELRRSTPAAP
ncbi:hypothetical protein [Streptomyces lydicus]|uniref:hypothetical protein n=1 Tax=Streptomyces lydicus TaxID=47763 RepID=UPI0037929FF4